MTRRHLLIITLVFVVLGGAIWLSTPGEPMYHGKPPSFWCDHLPFTGFGGRFTRGYRSSTNQTEANSLREMQFQALEAVNALGTNCLPDLLARLQRRNSPLQLESRKLAARLGFIKRSEVGIWHMGRMRALTGIVELGDRAQGIVPELTTLKTNADPWLSAAASYALNQISIKTAERIQYEERRKLRNAGLTKSQE